MSRNTDSAVTSASQSASLRHRWLVDIWSLSGGPFFACTGDRFLYVLGNTYSPIGGLGGIERIQEDSDPFPRAVRMWISLANSAAIYDALNETIYRKRSTIWRAFFDENYSCQGTPQVAFKGLINTADIIQKDPERGNYFEIELESRLRQRPLIGVLSKSIFQLNVSSTNDTFFDYSPEIRFYVPTWGGSFTGWKEGPKPPRNPKPNPTDDLY